MRVRGGFKIPNRSAAQRSAAPGDDDKRSGRVGSGRSARRDRKRMILFLDRSQQNLIMIFLKHFLSDAFYII